MSFCEGHKLVLLSAGSRRYPVFLLLILLAFYGGLYALWLSENYDVYFSLMHFLNGDPYKQPFFDMTGPLSWAQCHRLGYDVIKINPCDPLNRPLNYSPLLVYLPFGVRATVPAALAQNLAFLVSVVAVLKPGTRNELWLAVVACLSTACVFALERANLDLAEFVLVAMTTLFVKRGAAGRLLAYAVYFAGSIKFYTFALLLTVVDERPRRMMVVGITCAAVLGAFIFYYRGELAEILSLLPARASYSGQFSAFVFPYGGAEYVGLPPAAGTVLFGLLLVCCILLALVLAELLKPRLLRIDWTAPKYHLLLCGSILVAGCFFTQANLIYRAVFLLFLLPALYELRQTVLPNRSTIFRWAIGACLFLLWSELLRQFVEYSEFWLQQSFGVTTDLPDELFFVTRELVWWGLISLLLAVIFRFVLDSRSVRAIQTSVRLFAPGGMLQTEER